MKVTIKDIAKIAGVSTATVSMIMNNKDERISDRTREKVLKVVKETGYVPNMIASSMVTKKTKTIGLVIPDITNPFFPEVARGVEDRAKEDGYTVILCNSDNDIERENSYLSILQEKMVDGIIIAPSSKRTEYYENFKKIKIPLVSVDRDVEDINNYGKIVVDNSRGAYNAVMYMLRKDLSRIAHITGPFSSGTALDRLNGYKKALERSEIEFDSSIVFEGTYTIDWGTKAMDQIIEKNLDVDGVFCGNDIIAAGVYKSINKHGLSVPNDYSVIGFDNVKISEILFPELTTVKQPKYQIGYQSTQLLIDIINKKSIDKKEYILSTELVVRDSVK